MDLLKKLILLLVIFFPLKAFSLTITPATIKLQTEPGKPQTFSVKVQNESNIELQIEPSVEEFSFDKKGIKFFRPVGSLPGQVARYITFPTSTFNLKPGEIRQVNFSINVPKGIIGGNQAAVSFMSLPYTLPSLKLKTGIVMAVKLSSTVLQETIGTTIVKSRIKTASIKNTTHGNPAKLEMVVKNEGNTYIYGSASVAIMGKDGAFLGTFSIPDTLVLPGQEVLMSEALKLKLPPGSYNALITYIYRDKTITIDKPFNVE
jgi:hypothetical protein